MRRLEDGFTLIELLVSIAILTLIALSVTRLVDHASTLASSDSMGAEAAGQARQFLDRMAIDFSQMLRRSDVDYYIKTSTNVQPGNDQLAFFSEVPGYYPSTGSQSPLSLVAYRINEKKNAERLGKGLLWNGASPSGVSMVFLPITIAATWPQATSDAADPDYEIAATNLFRFEYYYWLINGNLSQIPWIGTSGHTTINGMRDVTAIVVIIATIDPQSRGLLSDTQLATLAGRMNDFTPSMGPGELTAQWQNALDSATNLPRAAISQIRIYQRHFQLAQEP